MMSPRWPASSRSMIARAPDWAIVPRFSISSSRVMPMPLSVTVTVLAFSSLSTWIANSAVESSTSWLVTISNWTR
jgi:hypothetical protein